MQGVSLLSCLHKFNRYLSYHILKSVQKIGEIIYRHRAVCVTNRPYHILVIRLDEIGDMVMMSPFLREVRRSYPLAHITLVVKPEVYPLVALCPYVDEILTFQKIVGRWAFYVSIWKTFRFARRFLKAPWDLALVPRFDVDVYSAGWIAFFSGAKRRIAYSEHVLSSKESSNRGYDGFYTEVLLPEQQSIKHEVERNLDMLRFLGKTVHHVALEVWTDGKDRETAQRLLGRRLLQNAKKIAVFLGAGRRNKEWPWMSYVAALKKVEKRESIQIILLGAGKETALYGAAFCSAYPAAMNFINQTTLRETIEILRHCDCYFGGDTGPMHLAAALKIPGVALFVNRLTWMPDGLDTAERFGAWQAPFHILRPEHPLLGCEYGCIKNESHCIQQISVDAAVSALMAVLHDEMS